MTPAEKAARSEDIAFLAATGENAIRAAARLGINRKALEQWCRDHGLRNEWAALASRDPRDHNSASAAMARAKLGVAA